MVDEVFVPAKDIYEAINRVMAKVGYVQKERGKEGGIKYTFASESALIAAIRPFLVEEGIVMWCSGISDFSMREYDTKNGAQMVDATGQYQWTFHHVASKTELFAVSRGEGSDTNDKASNKCSTCGMKYGLRQTFIIETGDDPDQFQNDERASRATEHKPIKKGETGHAEPPEGVKEGPKWPDNFLNAVVEKEYFKNLFEVKNAVIHSLILDPERTPLKNFIYWCGQYRKYREENNDVIASAGLADDEYRAQLARIKQDAATGA
jgi:hypothetical protein